MGPGNWLLRRDLLAADCCQKVEAVNDSRRTFQRGCDNSSARTVLVPMRAFPLTAAGREGNQGQRGLYA